MNPSIIIDKDCEQIQLAMAVALLKFSRDTGTSYAAIGRVIEREKQSVAQYINDTTEMPATCWLKAVAKWPELNDRFEFELDDAEKAFKARQRALPLTQPPPESQVA